MGNRAEGVEHSFAVNPARGLAQPDQSKSLPVRLHVERRGSGGAERQETEALVGCAARTGLRAQGFRRATVDSLNTLPGF